MSLALHFRRGNALFLLWLRMLPKVPTRQSKASGQTDAKVLDMVMGGDTATLPDVFAPAREIRKKQSKEAARLRRERGASFVWGQ